MSAIELTLHPLRAGLCADRDTALDVLVRVSSPEASGAPPPRPPLHLAFVIDRSGSMAGRPLEEAKRCVALMIDGLSPQDQAGLIVYDDQAQIVAPLTPVTNPGLLKAALAQVRSGGRTALHDGWALGAEMLVPAARSDGTVSRVMLLSDGQANSGLTDTARIAEDCAHRLASGVSTSTYGLGVNFNEELMSAMAASGGGNAYYGESADDLMDPFRREFDLLSALCARDLGLGLLAAGGVRVTLRNRYLLRDGRYRLPDLTYGARASAMLRLDVSADLAARAEGGLVHLLTASLTLTPLGAVAPLVAPAHLKLPLLPAEGFAALGENREVALLLAEFRAADLQDEAREAAARGDWDGVNAILRQARAESGGNPWVAASLESLERYARMEDYGRFSKEAHFKSSKMRSRLRSRDESEIYDRDAEARLPSYLRRKSEEGKATDGKNP